MARRIWLVELLRRVDAVLYIRFFDCDLLGRGVEQYLSILAGAT